jgi:hypothetical protein
MADAYTSLSEITALVANINEALTSFKAAPVGNIHIARRNLQSETRKLLYSLEEHNAEVWLRTFQVSLSLSTLR